MLAYETGLKSGDTRLLLSPNSEFFRYFNDPEGKSLDAPMATGPAGTAPAAAPAH